MIDDSRYITDNHQVWTLRSAFDVTGTRSVAFISFALNYAAAGADPFGYHVFNFAVHASAALLVWYLLVLTFRTPAMREEGAPPGSAAPPAVALFAALVFAVHPVNTQAVTYISQRFTSMATLFFLLSLVLYVKFRISVVASDGEKLSPASAALYFFSIVAALLAMKTKEISFTLPLITLLFEFTFLGGTSRGGEVKKRLLYTAPFILMMALIPLTLFFGSGGFVPGTPGSDAALREHQLLDLTRTPVHVYFLTELTVITSYIGLLLLPRGQHFFYDRPYYDTLFTAPVLFSLTLLLAIGALAFYLRMRGGRGRPLPLLASFMIFWFFITLSVESSFFPIKDVMAEHRLYLPSVGAAAVFSIGFFSALVRLFKGGGSVTMPLIIGALVLVTLLAACYKRNSVWADGITFWENEVAHSPSLSVVQMSLGVAYSKAGMKEEALSAYTESLSLNPDYAAAHNNLGFLYLKESKFEEAIKEFKEAIRLRADLTEAYYNLGLAYGERGGSGDRERAVFFMKKSVEISKRLMRGKGV